MGLFDSHSHLNDEKFDEDREEQIKKIRESGVSNFITAGYSVESSKKALEIAKKYPYSLFYYRMKCMNLTENVFFDWIV